MGSKKLKAIVAYGNREIPVARPDQLMASVKREVPSLVENMKAMHDYGTTCSMEATEACGDLPIMNRRVGSWSEAAAKSAAIPLAMDLYEKEIISLRDAGAIELAWGNVKAVIYGWKASSSWPFQNTVPGEVEMSLEA